MTRRFWVEIYEPAKRTIIASTTTFGEGEEVDEGKTVEDEEEAGHADAKKLGVVELCTGCTARGIPAPMYMNCYSKGLRVKGHKTIPKFSPRIVKVGWS